jgi:hypothetical protein
MREHVGVHRGRQHHWRLRGEVEGTQEIVGDPVGELADDVGRARRDEQEVDAVGDSNVLDVRIHPRPPL